MPVFFHLDSLILDDIWSEEELDILHLLDSYFDLSIYRSVWNSTDSFYGCLKVIKITCKVGRRENFLFISIKKIIHLN